MSSSNNRSLFHCRNSWRIRSPKKAVYCRRLIVKVGQKVKWGVVTVSNMSFLLGSGRHFFLPRYFR